MIAKQITATKKKDLVQGSSLFGEIARHPVQRFSCLVLGVNPYHTFVYQMVLYKTRSKRLYRKYTMLSRLSAIARYILFNVLL